MKLVTAEQMRILDRKTIEEVGVPGEELMERAGQGVFAVIQRTLDVAGYSNPAIHVVAGRGNNGGDGFAVARMLKEVGYTPWVWLAGSIADIKGDALQHFNLMRQADVAVSEVPTRDDWDDLIFTTPPGDLVVDAVLGIGVSGPARGPAAGAIRFINQAADTALIVSIDIPSGLNADTGAAEGEVVCADVTVTMGLPKTGLVAPEALPYVGTVEVVDIGIPPELAEDIMAGDGLELIYSTDLRPLLPRRARASHKGQYGRVLVIGGAAGMMGAIAMAARAAVRSGSGLVNAIVPAGIAPEVASASLETMVSGVEDTLDGCIAAEQAETLAGMTPAFDAVLLGPGLSRSDDALRLVEAMLAGCQTDLVLDADALAVLAGRLDALAAAAARLIITPHPGELALLTGRSVDDIQADRPAAAQAAAEASGAVVVLKGAGTVVASPGHAACINLTGNPGMATGGSGDVLAGLLVGLLGQGLEPYDAARAAVYLHGRAGDLVAWRKSQAGLIATDIIEELPYAFRDVALR